MGFKAEVDKVLPGEYMPGLKALEGRDGKRVECKDPRRLAGSVNLDEALRPADPDGHRWDYGIGIKRDAGKEEVFWVEVHPASTSNVQEVMDKLAWLKKWLREKAPALQRITAADGYVWIASGRVDILPRSHEARLMFRAGLDLPRKLLRIE